MIAARPVPPAVDHRTLPRRRGEALEKAILNAAIDELAAGGYHDLRMERVAERARASKASLYRRWPTKVELVTEAVFRLVRLEVAVDVDTGALRGDLLTQFRAVAAVLAGPAGIAVRGVISDGLRDPALAARFRTFARGSTVATMRVAVRRARERGELDGEGVTDRQLDAGLAALRLHFLTHAEPIPDDVVVGIVDEIVIPLIRAGGAGPGG